MSHFKVTGLSCGGCVNRVTKAIKGIDAEAIVAVDLPSGILTIENSKIISSDVIAAIELVGYGATSS